MLPSRGAAQLPRATVGTCDSFLQPVGIAGGQKSSEPSGVWDGAEERGDTSQPPPKVGLAVHIPEMCSLICHWLRKQSL